MILEANTRLLLASDVDDTLLDYNQVMNDDLLSIVSKLLASDKVRLAIITGNDYVNLQKQRVVEPIPTDLRKNLIVYADGCTRKITFTDSGQEVLNRAYRSRVGLDQDDKKWIRSTLHHKIREWRRRYPELSVPDVYIESLDENVQITIGPLQGNGTASAARRSQLRERLLEELRESCTDVRIIPSDVLWVKAHCKATRSNISQDRLEQNLNRLMEDFAGFSTPVIIDREEQLAIKPVKPRLRPRLAREINTLVSGPERCTNNEYNALIGGRVTIDIQRAGIDKAFAIRDLQSELALLGDVLYFGDSFGPDGNDRPVAFAKEITCLNVGSAERVPEGIINLGGGPAMTLAYWRGLLWALSGEVD